MVSFRVLRIGDKFVHNDVLYMRVREKKHPRYNAINVEYPSEKIYIDPSWQVQTQDEYWQGRVAFHSK